MEFEASSPSGFPHQSLEDDPALDVVPNMASAKDAAPVVIPWEPIETMPDHMRDGRQVLLWARSGASVCTFQGWGWAVVLDGAIIDRLNSLWPLFWCEISTPEHGLASRR